MDEKMDCCFLATVTLEAFCFVPVSTGSVEEAQKEIVEKGLPEGCEWVIRRYITHVEQVETANPAQRALHELIESLESRFPNLKEQELQALAAKEIESLSVPRHGQELLDSIFNKLDRFSNPCATSTSEESHEL